MKFIDLHADTVLRMHQKKEGLFENTGHIDIQKLQKGGSMAQFFALYVPTNESAKEYNVTVSPHEFMLELFELYDRELKKNEQYIKVARNAEDILQNEKDGKISAVLTLEDGTPIEGKMERIDEWFNRGLRLITLTWNYETCFGFPNSKNPELMKKGLKPFGIDAVRHMNELGVLIDVSHLSDGGFYDVAKHSSKPFVASHSCARALCNHPRCMTDDMLKVLGEKGGIVGINFCAAFIEENATYTSIDGVLRHMLHIADKAGIDALAFGSDFDGIDGTTLEFKDYTGMPQITKALEKHFSPGDIEKICYKNALRVIQESLK